MLKKLFLFLLVLGGMSLLFSRTLKVAVVNYQDILSSYSETKKINDKLMKAKQERQAKLDKMQNELKKMESDFMAQEKKLSEKEKQKKKEEFQKKLMVLREQMQRYTEELKVLQRKYLTKLDNTIKDAINKVAKKAGYDLVLDEQAVFRGGKNITDKVIEYLNKKAMKK